MSAVMALRGIARVRALQLQETVNIVASEPLRLRTFPIDSSAHASRARTHHPIIHFGPSARESPRRRTPSARSAAGLAAGALSCGLRACSSSVRSGAQGSAAAAACNGAASAWTCAHPHSRNAISALTTLLALWRARAAPDRRHGFSFHFQSTGQRTIGCQRRREAHLTEENRPPVVCSMLHLSSRMLRCMLCDLLA